MQAVTTIGLNIAKSVFQVHSIDAKGKVLIRRQLKRRYVLAFFEKLSPCLVGIEASPDQIDQGTAPVVDAYVMQASAYQRDAPRPSKSVCPWWTASP